MKKFDFDNPPQGVIDAIDILMEGHEYYDELYIGNKVEIPEYFKNIEVDVEGHRIKWSIFFQYFDSKILFKKRSYSKWASDLIRELREVLRPSRGEERGNVLWTLLPHWREYVISQVKVLGIDRRYPINQRFAFFNEGINDTENYLKKIPKWVSDQNRKEIRRRVIEVIAEDLYPAWSLLQLGQYTKSYALDLKSLLLKMDEEKGKLVKISQSDKKDFSIDHILAWTDWMVDEYLKTSEKDELFKILLREFGVEKSMGTIKINPLSRLKTIRANLRKQKK